MNDPQRQSPVSHSDTGLIAPVGEFCSALVDPYSYNLRKNIYIWFGMAWGIPIPLVTVAIQSHFLGLAGNTSPLFSTLCSPVQWFFMAHPLLFASLFGVLGAIRNVKDRQLESMVNQLKEHSTHDPLTGLKNRRYFAHNFYDECARSQRREETLSLLFLDIDHFKQVNDTHGHHIGDVVLKDLAAFIKSRCRPYDTAVRWGGEEFIVLLRATNSKAAVVFAERIRIGIETGKGLSVGFRITISIGVAEYQEEDTLEALVDRADQALYEAKRTGRNKVVCWEHLQQKKNESQ